MTRALRGLLRSLAGNRKAGTAIEYGLIAALIVVALVGALSQLAHVTSGMWNDVATNVADAH